MVYMAICVVCGKQTLKTFNINLKRVPICESCAVTIAIQQLKNPDRKRAI
ncbi:unnamed protein product [marine sediment metagenome]|uniref:Uncharacterized protein n=1 Tax=marine sediment metagenome TaxID=412755 RepID=X1C784_9ZZZZ